MCQRPVSTLGTLVLTHPPPLCFTCTEPFSDQSDLSRIMPKLLNKSSVSVTWPWPVPVPSHRVLLNPQIEIRQYLCQGDNFKYNVKFRRCPYSFTNTHSPITLTNFSSINLVFIFRCSCPPRNTVYERRVDLSVWTVSLSSHWHSYISLLCTSLFIVS
jgi:hypothetical protein